MWLVAVRDQRELKLEATPRHALHDAHRRAWQGSRLPLIYGPESTVLFLSISQPDAKLVSGMGKTKRRLALAGLVDEEEMQDIPSDRQPLTHRGADSGDQCRLAVARRSAVRESRVSAAHRLQFFQIASTKQQAREQMSRRKLWSGKTAVTAAKALLVRQLRPAFDACSNSPDHAAQVYSVDWCICEISAAGDRCSKPCWCCCFCSVKRGRMKCTEKQRKIDSNRCLEAMPLLLCVKAIAGVIIPSSSETPRCAFHHELYLFSQRHRHIAPSPA